MSTVLLFTHLGLGDHIMCNGMVREYAKTHQKVGIFCKTHNLATVRAMFRDLPSVVVIPINRDQDAYRYIRLNALKLWLRPWKQVVYVGFHLLNATSGEQFERQFYNLANVPIEKKWDSFHIKRDLAAEEKLRQALNVPDEYIFAHDDSRFPLEQSRTQSQLPLVRPQKGMTENMLDYCGIMEGAKELHVIDSSFMFLADCLPMKGDATQRRVIHRYARENPTWQLPLLRKAWEVLQ